MNEALEYPRIINVAVRHSGTFKNLSNIISLNLIPASSMLPGVDLSMKTRDELQQLIEVQQLDPTEYTRTYSEINVLKNLGDYEWVILKRPGSKFLAAPIKGYVYAKNTSSPIHHYIEFISPSLTIPYSDIDSTLLHRISNADNLTELTASAAELINAHRPGSLERTRQSVSLEPNILPTVAFPSQTIPTLDQVLEDKLAFEDYFSSVFEMQKYLITKVSNLTEQYVTDSDIAFSGKWENGDFIRIAAYRLTGNRGHGGWYVRGIFEY
jgi:hypothetical protein